MKPKEKLREKDLQRISRLRLIDDDFMTICFDGYIEGANLLLRLILQRDDLKIKEVKTQKALKNLEGRDLRLDIYATDINGAKYNIEIQRSDKGAIAQRARYHSSMIDADMLMPGQKFDELNTNIVIFITEKDVLGLDEPIYHIDRYIKEGNHLPFNDGSHIIYVNGEKKGSDTDLEKLMSDFYCTESKDMNYKELSDRVKYYKETKKGAEDMCQIWDEIRAEGREEGVQEGVLIGKEENALRMIKLGKFSLEDIALSTDLPIGKIKELAEAKSA